MDIRCIYCCGLTPTGNLFKLTGESSSQIHMGGKSRSKAQVNGIAKHAKEDYVIIHGTL
jgi:hypothetical protein